jgi:hypothetical protein
MINMRRYFLLTLFTFSMILVESTPSIAQGNFYERLRKLKNPTESQINEAREQTTDEKRRKKMDEISMSAKKDAEQPNPPRIAEDPADAAADDEFDAKMSPAESNGVTSSIPQNHKEKSQPAPSSSYDSGPTVSVNPGDVDELEFPGATPTPKPSVKKKK